MGWAGQIFGVEVPHRTSKSLGAQAWCYPPPSSSPQQQLPPHPWHLSPPVSIPLLCFHSLHCRLAASSPHLGRHYYFANKTCPACPGRWAVWRDFLKTAVLIVAPDSCKLQSQRVALPAREEPCPLPDLCLIIPYHPSWDPSPICKEVLVLLTSGCARPIEQVENHTIWRWQGKDRHCKVGCVHALVLVVS